MPLNVKDERAHQAAREPARVGGRSITGVVTEALEEIALHCASLPLLDDRSADEILGYDEHGLPHSADAPGIS